MKDLRMLVGPQTYTKLASTLQMNTADSAMGFTSVLRLKFAAYTPKKILCIHTDCIII